MDLSFSEVANSRFVYMVCGSALLIVIGIIVNFLRMSLQRAHEVGIERTKIQTTMKTTLLVSIGPAMSIMVPLIVMIKLLGAPWSWLRLSVVGSAQMEMTLADMALRATGFSGLQPDILPGRAFGIVAMSVGIAVGGGILLNILFSKSYSLRLEKMKQSTSKWPAMLISSIFAGFMISFSATTIAFKGAVAVATLLTAVGVTYLIEWLIGKYDLKKLKEYSFALSLIISMASAVMWIDIL